MQLFAKIFSFQVSFLNISFFSPLITFTEIAGLLHIDDICLEFSLQKDFKVFS